VLITEGYMTLIRAYTLAGTYSNHPTLSEAIANLRQDPFDRAYCGAPLGVKAQGLQSGFYGLSL
jgi:hypothetical protein